MPGKTSFECHAADHRVTVRRELTTTGPIAFAKNMRGMTF